MYPGDSRFESCPIFPLGIDICCLTPELPLLLLQEENKARSIKANGNVDTFMIYKITQVVSFSKTGSKIKVI